MAKRNLKQPFEQGYRGNKADKDDEPFDKDGNDNSKPIPQPWGGGDWAGKKKKKKKKT